MTIWRIGKGNVRFQLRIQSSLPPPALGYRAGFFQGGIADPEHLPPSAAPPSMEGVGVLLEQGFLSGRGDSKGRIFQFMQGLQADSAEKGLYRMGKRREK